MAIPRDPLSGRLVTRGQLIKLRQGWRRRASKVVFTNGVFDLIHPGHIDILNRSKRFGDLLVVGINSDASVRRLKGPNRPINKQLDRARVLLALRSVDFVCVFSEDTPLELIRALRPDVLVKGSEYTIDTIVGADIVIADGGTVKRVKMRQGYSTTGLVTRVSRKRM